MLHISCSLAALLIHAAETDLPKVERDFTVVSPTQKAGKPLAELIPPASVARLIISSNRLNRSPIRSGVKTEFDPDKLIAHAFNSQAKGRNWGLLATERSASEFLIVTKNGDIYRLEVLCDLKGAVTALHLYGKGFACRYDLHFPEG